jgi:hypothetical protein
MTLHGAGVFRVWIECSSNITETLVTSGEKGYIYYAARSIRCVGGASPAQAKGGCRLI